MNCVLSSYHIHEWVWARWLKAEAPVEVRGTLIRDKNSFVTWLANKSPHFELVQQLANGAKHCLSVHSTQAISGWGRGPYGVGPYGAPYLLIDLGETLPPAHRYLVASDVIGDVVAFWREFFAEESIPGPR
jgi:hypothetical protein